MNKKIAVLGSRRAMDHFIYPVENPTDFILVKDFMSVEGYEISSIIRLSGWREAYQNPMDLYQIIKMKIR